jgi:hypothetical protein
MPMTREDVMHPRQSRSDETWFDFSTAASATGTERISSDTTCENDLQDSASIQRPV